MAITSALLVASACGRIAFDATATPTDATPPDDDGATPFEPATGELDPGFGTGGYQVFVTSGDFEAENLVVRPGGGYLAFGVHWTSGQQMGLLAVTQAGMLDATYGNSGLAEFGLTNADFGYGLLPLGDGRLFVIGDGRAATSDDIEVGIVDSTGMPDPAFGGVGLVAFDVDGMQDEDTAFRAARVASGIVVCGIADYTGDSRIALLQVRLDGTLDPAYGMGGIVSDNATVGGVDECRDIIALPDGRTAIAGAIDDQLAISVYTAAGTLDTSFGTNGRYVRSGGGSRGDGVTLAPDGDIVAVGRIGGQGAVVRLAPDGTPHAGFGSSGVVTISEADALVGLVPQPDGSFVAVGYRQTGGITEGVLVRVLADGSLDPGFATGGVFTLAISSYFELTSVVLDGSTIVAAGTTYDGSTDQAVLVRLR